MPYKYPVIYTHGGSRNSIAANSSNQAELISPIKEYEWERQSSNIVCQKCKIFEPTVMLSINDNILKRLYYQNISDFSNNLNSENKSNINIIMIELPQIQPSSNKPSIDGDDIIRDYEKKNLQSHLIESKQMIELININIKITYNKDIEITSLNDGNNPITIKFDESNIIKDISYQNKKIYTIIMQNFGKYCCQKCHLKIHGSKKINDPKMAHERDNICRFKVNNYPTTASRPIVISYSFDYVKDSYSQSSSKKNLIMGSMGNSSSIYTYIYSNPNKSGIDSFNLDKLNNQLKYNLYKIISSKYESTVSSSVTKYTNAVSSNAIECNFNKVVIIDFSNVTSSFITHISAPDEPSISISKAKEYIKVYFTEIFNKFDSRTLIILCCAEKPKGYTKYELQSYNSYVDLEEECGVDNLLKNWHDNFYEQFKCKIVIFKEEISPNLSNFYYFVEKGKVRRCGWKEVNVDEVIHHAIDVASNCENIKSIEIHTNDGNEDNGPFGSSDLTSKRKILLIDTAEKIALDLKEEFALNLKEKLAVDLTEKKNKPNIDIIINHLNGKNLEFSTIEKFHDHIEDVFKIDKSQFVDMNFSNKKSNNIVTAIKNVLDKKQSKNIVLYNYRGNNVEPNTIYNNLKDINLSIETTDINYYCPLQKKPNIFLSTKSAKPVKSAKPAKPAKPARRCLRPGGTRGPNIGTPINHGAMAEPRITDNCMDFNNLEVECNGYDNCIYMKMRKGYKAFNYMTKENFINKFFPNDKNYGEEEWNKLKYGRCYKKN